MHQYVSEIPRAGPESLSMYVKGMYMCTCVYVPMVSVSMHVC